MNQQVREIYDEEIQQLAEKLNEAIKRPPQPRETQSSTLDEDIKELVIRHVSDLMVEIAKDKEEKCSG